MSRSLSAGMLSHIQGESLTLSTCLKLRKYPDTLANVGSHVYWRIYFIENYGDDQVSMVEMEMRATVGGADQCTGGTATASSILSGSQPASEAFDNSTADASTWVSSAGDAVGAWLEYQFASAVSVRQIAIMPVTAANLNRSPKEFKLQFSDDGTYWTDALHIQDEPQWADKSWRYYVVPATYYVANYYGYTNHDEDIVYDGLTYSASSGYTPSEFSQSTGMSVDNAELVGLLITGGITAASIEAGDYDGAEVEVFFINPNDTADGIIGPVIKGTVGELRTEDDLFTAEVRSLAQRLQTSVISTYQPGCRAVLGDSKCKVPLDAQEWSPSTAYDAVDGLDRTVGDVVVPSTFAGYHYECTVAGTSGASEPTWGTTPGGTFTDGTVTWRTLRWRAIGTVSGVVDRRLFNTNLPEADDYWNLGEIVWLTGANTGYRMEVKDYSNSSGSTELYLPMPNNVSAADTFLITIGCGKNFTDDCKTIFGNGKRFRGEPYLPGRDTVRTNLL